MYFFVFAKVGLLGQCAYLIVVHALLQRHHLGEDVVILFLQILHGFFVLRDQVQVLAGHQSTLPRRCVDFFARHEAVEFVGGHRQRIGRQVFNERNGAALKSKECRVCKKKASAILI